jgi:hypothetical protein
MSRLLTCSLLGVFLVAPGSRANDARAARALLDRAIDAMGGAKALAGARALSGKSKGTFRAAGKATAVANEWTVQGLDRLKWNTELTENDNTTAILLVLDRGKGWIKGGANKANELSKEVHVPFRHGFAALRLAETLLPLREKAFTLSPLGELKVAGKPAVGLKASRKGWPDIDLFFDKTTRLPVKVEMRLPESEAQEATYTALFAGYKKVAGRQHFTKLTVQRDGKVVLEMERSDVKAIDKVEDETFAKP